MRVYNWEARLAAYVARVAREGFAWGQHDCALFAAGAVEAVTGIDPAADWRGRYSSFEGGVKLIRKAGFSDHIAAARAWFPKVSRAEVMPGDLAVIDTGAGSAVSVVQGEMLYVLTEAGLGLIPAEQAASFLAVR
ncbi:DUF6950 family protein [Paracoccus sp. p3-h83]|uniref:DUF6950 family protein n=1 Tax=Paracoccus sp. p3-h83 TaxID=3342805 RepID=UPI0035BC3466